MKQFISIIILFLAGLTLKAQVTHSDYWREKELPLSDTTKNEIDPRQYVRVLYKKKPNYKEKENLEMQRIIWHWNDSGYFQRFRIIDNEGLLYIYFKKNELANNYNFQGNISLEALLKGKEGERKIEVGPYSLVGVDRKEIGIESFPPTTVAQFLFNTIIEMKRTIVSVDFNKYDSIFDSNEDYIALQDIFTTISEAHKTALKDKIDTSESVLPIIRYYTESDPTYYNSLVKYANTPEKFTYSDLLRDLQAIIQDFRGYLRREGAKMRTDMAFLQTRLALINSYLSSFEKAGADAVKAFLDLASKDKINFIFLKSSLVSDEKRLSAILENNDIKKNNELLLSTKENLELSKRVVNNLSILSSIQGSKMESLIKKKYVTDKDVIDNAWEVKAELEEQNGTIPYKDFTAYFKKTTDSTIVPNKYSRYIFLRLMEKSLSFEQFKQELSVMAAEIIYRKLVYATIDLGKSGAQPGDILYLNVIWKNIDGEKDSTEMKSSSLPIGKYYLRQTGWKTEIAESFYLVERINEPSNDPNVSKSNFKGAYGASIMRTFYYNENYERTFGGRFLNWAQPSIGFNISYLDFYSNKDIEIGAGLQLGLFKNVFFLGTGINLHSIRGDEKKSAVYFMFGVSFTNIAAKFKNKDQSGE